MNKIFSCLALVAFVAAFPVIITAEPKGEPEAIRECGNIHDLNMHQFPNNTSAVFINDECALNCTVDGRQLHTAIINEGYICPRNVRGHCHRGKCDAPINPDHHGNAVIQCGNLNHIDTTKYNNSGTHYEQEECKVVCAIAGQETSEHVINEGYQCPANKNGTCREGVCTIAHTVPPKPTTVPTPKVTPHSTIPATTKPPTPKPTTKPATPSPTTVRVDTFRNIEFERFSSHFISGQMTDNSKVTNISVCYKSVNVRTFDRNACKYYCSSTEISCIIESPDRQFPKEQTYFLFNVWRNGISIGDSIQSLQELFTDIKSEPGNTIAHNGMNNYNIHAITNLILYNVVNSVGNLTMELNLQYRRV